MKSIPSIPTIIITTNYNYMKKHLLLRSAALCLVLSLSVVSVMAQQLAFPGAAGWGRFAKGARASSTPTVYHVTNLNDSGTGSLRDAVSKSNRIVVFDVSGVIKISSRIVFSSNLYVAGQTAPGEGITVYGNGVSFSGASNIICRYLRVRMGHGGDSGKDCAGIANGSNMIFDHCSFSWGLDETFSINSNDLSTEWNVTLQNCIIGQGLLSHSAGGLMQGQYISLYRNFYCDNSTRNNKVKGTNQYANNIVYNWQNGCYIMGGDSDGSSYANIQSNLFINGPAKGGNALGGGNGNFHFYGDDNWQDSDMDGVFNPSLNTSDGGGDRQSTPYDYPELELYPGNKLLELSLPTVGASLPYRDQADCYMVDEVLSYGKSGKLITYETSLPIGAPDTWAWYAGVKPKDTDGDGMPDAWETANGTNPNLDDATVKASNGYLNIENYINSISADTREFFLRRPILLASSAATTSTITLSWRDYTDGESGFVVEMLDGSEWKECGRAAANAKSYVVKGLAEATKYTFRVKAFGSDNGVEKYSEAVQLTATTRQTQVGIVDIDSYQPDVTNTTEVADGQKLLIHATEFIDYKLTAPIKPSCVVVTGDANTTISGEAIGGAASLNKGDKGTLVIANKNTYTGATVLHDGVLEFSSLANGGEASGLGASISDPSNWIMDGGTYRYTGTSVATDRSARITNPTTLEIKNASTTVTANGSFEGTSDLILDGEGTLAVKDAANFFKYSGSTVLKSGTLKLTDIEAASKIFGSSSHKVVFEGGTFDFAYKKDDSQTYQFPIEVVEGTTSKWRVGTTGAIKNDITGAGDLILELPYVRLNFQTNLPNFNGRIIALGSPIEKNQSLLYHNTQFTMPNVVFDLKKYVYMAAWTTNAVNVIGGLSGDAGSYLVGSGKKTANFKCSWTIGGANTDETFRGTITNLPAGLESAYSGTVSITKVGKGYWRLTGTNDYKGATQVTGGTLIVNGSNNGTGVVNIMSGAALKGEGTVKGKVTVYANSYLCGGDTIVSQKVLKLAGGLALQKNAILQVPIAVNSNTGAILSNQIRVTGDLSVNADSKIEIDFSSMGNKTLKEGDKILVFNTIGLITSKTGEFSEANILPATPGEGLKWDISTLMTDGYIKVASSTADGIVVPNADPHTPNAFYDLTGRRIISPKRGLYILNGKKYFRK